MAVDPQVDKVVTYLVNVEKKIANGIFGSEQRPWMNFDDVKKVGKFDYRGVADIFSREGSNNTYISAKSNVKAKSKEVHTSKLGADFLAQFERDYRMRQRSRIRMFVHGGCRADGNGTNNGAIRKNTIDWFSRILGEEKPDA